MVRNGEFRTEFNGAIVVGDSAVQISLGFCGKATGKATGLFGKATVVVGTGVFRIELNGAVVVGDSAVVIALGFSGKATFVVVRRERGNLSCGDSREHQT